MILIAGASGFIGTYLCKFLLNKNIDFVAIENNRKISNLLKKDIQIMKGSINSIKLNDNILYNIDCIINLSGISDKSDCENNPELAYKVNCDGVENLLNIIKLYPNIKLIHLSSSEVYKHKNNLLYKESDQTSSENVYGKTKIKAEKLITNYSIKYQLNSTIIRLFNTFGYSPFKNNFFNNVLSRALRNEDIILKNMRKKIDFIYIKDVINAIYLIYKSNYSNKLVNICSSKPISLLEFTKKIVNSSNSSSNIISNDSTSELNKTIVGSNLLAKDLYSWIPKFDYESALFDTLNNERY